MKFPFRLLPWVLVPVLLIAPPVALLVLAIDDGPALLPSETPRLADLKRAQILMTRYDPRKVEAGRDTIVAASEADLNTALAAGLTHFRRVRSRVAVGGFGVAVVVSAELPVPANPFGRFVNIFVIVEPSTDGLQVGKLSVGRLTIPEGLEVPLIRFALDALVRDGKGDEIVSAIRSVEVSGKTVTLTYRPTPNGIDDLKFAAREAVAAGDPEAVRTYYGKLIDLARAHSSGPTSLTVFLAPLFQLARQRSRTRDPVDENRAVVLALSMFFGDREIERLIGDVRTEEMKRAEVGVGHVGLAGRHDYMKHFVISAGLALTAGRELANKVGEDKEIYDAGTISGFSFPDIAADRAGIRFAEIAIASAQTAKRVQEILAGTIDEPDYFPNVRDLPEGLSEAEFERRYGDTDDPAYLRMVAEIDRRIDRIPLYR